MQWCVGRCTKRVESIRYEDKYTRLRAKSSMRCILKKIRFRRYMTVFIAIIVASFEAFASRADSRRAQRRTTRHRARQNWCDLAQPCVSTCMPATSIIELSYTTRCRETAETNNLKRSIIYLWVRCGSVPRESRSKSVNCSRLQRASRRIMRTIGLLRVHASPRGLPSTRRVRHRRRKLADK